MEINVLVDEEFAGSFEVSWLRHVVEQVLTAEEADADSELSLVITNQEKIRQLNRDYRGKDAPTDVLSFAMLRGASADRENAMAPFVTPPDGQSHLGEVIISCPQAVIQAEEYGHSVEKEITRLIIHGVLHLLGYDHAEPDPERQMRVREAAVLSQVEGG